MPGNSFRIYNARHSGYLRIEGAVYPYPFNRFLVLIGAIRWGVQPGMDSQSSPAMEAILGDDLSRSIRCLDARSVVGNCDPTDLCRRLGGHQRPGDPRLANNLLAGCQPDQNCPWMKLR